MWRSLVVMVLLGLTLTAVFDGIVLSWVSGENNKAPKFYLGALNLFILRREQDIFLSLELLV